jgi:hypothetical protein
MSSETESKETQERKVQPPDSTAITTAYSMREGVPAAGNIGTFYGVCCHGLLAA